MMFLAGKASSPVRTQIWQLLAGDPALHSPTGLSHAEYLCAMASSVFCLAPRGHAAWSPRLDEALASGCIPVIIADSYTPPFADVLDYSAFAVSVPQAEVPRLKEILAAITPAQRAQLLANGARAAPVFRYNHPSMPYGGDATPLIVFQVVATSFHFFPSLPPTHETKKNKKHAPIDQPATRAEQLSHVIHSCGADWENTKAKGEQGIHSIMCNSRRGEKKDNGHHFTFTTSS